MPVQPGTGTQTVELKGPLGSSRMPALCVSCAAPYGGFAVVESVFTRTHSDSPNTYVVGRLSVPLCVACLGRHNAERPPIDAVKRVLLMFRTPEVFAGIAPGAASLFVLWIAIPRFLRFDLISMGFFSALSGFFGLIAFFGFRAAWQDSERYAVQPPSSVSSAIRFSDDRADLFEPEHHTYILSNPQFAAAFIELNKALIWRPDGRQANVARQKRNLSYIVFGIVVACVVIYSLLDEFVWR